MTEAQCHRLFIEEILPLVREQYEQDGIPDIPARCEAFNNWTDSLCQDGIITEEQYNTWGHPACNEYPK